MRGYKPSKDIIKKDIDTDQVEEGRSWYYDTHFETNDWKIKSFHDFSISCHKFCCIREGCKTHPRHMIVHSSCDMEWAAVDDTILVKLNEQILQRKRDHIRYYEDNWEEKKNWTINGMSADVYLDKEKKELQEHENEPLYYAKTDLLWCHIYFMCEDHLRPCLSNIFHPGGLLNGHYIRRHLYDEKTKDKDQWVHCKDSFWYNRSENIYEGDTVFTLNNKNYLRTLRSKNSELLRKRNFNFWYWYKSWRMTGFCCVCEHEAGMDLGKCVRFDEGCQPDICSCGCPKSIHYIDDDWDRVFDEHDRMCQ
jgi:hypothetical protein